MKLKDKIWLEIVELEDRIAYHSIEMERLKIKKHMLQKDLNNIGAKEVKQDAQD